MTMSDRALAWLESRALDVELLDRLGWASSRRSSGEAVVIPFHRNGQVTARKYRLLDASEGQGNWQSEGQTIAWNEDVLRDQKLLGQPLIITEGQFDAVAAIQCGFQRTVSVPHGAPVPNPGKTYEEITDAQRYEWIREIAPLMSRERCEEIILATDGDAPGAQLLHDLSVILGRYRCKFLTYPKTRRPEALGRERCKDLNEVLEDYGSKGVVETIGRAQWMRVEGVFLMSQLPPLPEQRVYETGFALLGENYKVRLGDFVVITGVPGLGKTTFANDVGCRLSLRHGLKIGWASFEQAPQRDHRRALRSWYGVPAMLGEQEREGKPEYRMSAAEIADADAWIEENHVFIVPSEDDDVTLDWMIDKMEVAVVRHGVRVMIIDPWNEMDHTRERDETMTEYVGRAIKTLKRFARKFQVHLIVIAHPTKSLKDGDGKYKMPTLYDISDCYSDDTEALTKRGWLRHDSITVEDEVLCFDPESGASMWSRPTRVVQHPHSGEMVRFRGYGYDLLVSPNHRMVVKPGWPAPGGSGFGRPQKWGRGWSVAPARDLLTGARFSIPRTAGALDGDAPDALHVHGEIYPAEDLLELVGWWVAEGSTASTGVTLCQAADTEGATRISELLDRCRIAHTKAERPDPRGFKTMATWYIGAKHPGLVRWLKEKAGCGAANKRTPYPIFSLSPGLKAAFLNGYIAGDGHRPAARLDTASATTTSQMLVDDLQRLAVELGIPVTAHRRRAANKTHAPSWQVNFGDPDRRSATMQPDRNASVEAYEGDIWCLTVPTGAYFVRRNGAVCVSGNSANWYNKCDLGLIVHKEEADTTIVKVQKSKYHEIIGRPGEVRLAYSKDERRFIEQERIA